MTIRRILLFAFLAVGLLPAMLLTWLAFTSSRAALRAEIGQILQLQARTAAANLDRTLFDRLQNAATWSHLQVMQDLHVGDVDRRISAFLAELQLRYGTVYAALHATDLDGRIVASSAPAALGTTVDEPGQWLSVELPGESLRLALPPASRQAAAAAQIRAPIVSEFTGQPLGQLVAVMDWQAITEMLDTAAQQQRMLLIVDADGRIVAASSALRAGIAPGLRLPPEWRVASDSDAAARPAEPLPGGQVMVGRALSRGYADFAGLGWTTLVLQPVDEALRPVRRMSLVLGLLLLLVGVAIVIVAGVISARIARPVAALTQFTRGFRGDGATRVPAPAGPAEIGELARAFAAMVDDLERSQRALVQASKLAAVGEFAAVMAHEIRTPLGILRSSAQMLEREPAASPESRELVGFIGSETQRLNRLVSTLLDQARLPREPQLAPHNIEGLIERCLAMLAHQAQRQGVEFVRELRASDPVVEVDDEQITQVLLNLVMNALQVLEQGGTIRVGTHDDGEHMVVEVNDSGPGVPPDERARIFEPFVFHRKGGLGLGLAVTRQIVQAHGGQIDVDQSEEGGARFSIRLPRRGRTP